MTAQSRFRDKILCSTQNNKNNNNKNLQKLKKTTKFSTICQTINLIVSSVTTFFYIYESFVFLSLSSKKNLLHKTIIIIHPYVCVRSLGTFFDYGTLNVGTINRKCLNKNIYKRAPVKLNDNKNLQKKTSTINICKKQVK